MAAGGSVAGDSVATGSPDGAVAAAPPQDVIVNATIKINMILRIIQTHFQNYGKCDLPSASNAS